MQNYVVTANYDVTTGESIIDLPAEITSDFVLLVNGQVLTNTAYLRTGRQITVTSDISRDTLEILIVGTDLTDLNLLIGRIAALEACCDKQPPVTVLPDLRLDPLRLADIPDTSTDLGFADLQLYRADWSVWDMAYDGNDLLTDSSLRTAIIISCWTDAAANDYDGWWGDAYIEKPVSESLLWTLIGKPANTENAALGIDYIKKALQWLLDDGWITSLAVTGEAQKDPASQLWIFAFRVDHTNKDGSRSTLYL